MLHYRKYICETSNQWVTFLHGAGGSSAIWFKQVRDFSKKYNVLLIDLRGHGESQMKITAEIKSAYTFPKIAAEIMEVLDFEKIEKSYFAGISLGTIVIRQIAEQYPEKVLAMIMGGAVLDFNLKAKILLKLSFILKSVLPYLLFYKIFAYIIMPDNVHKKSRNLFIREAQKICKEEFHRLFNLTIGINQVFKYFSKTELPIPTLYLMGEDDHLFLGPIKKLLKTHVNYSQLIIVPKSGHICNVDNSEFFNNQALSFIAENKKLK